METSPQQQQPSSPQSAQEVGEKISLKILIADDIPQIKKMLEMLLSRKYSSIESVEDGQDLVDRLDSGQSFDFIITDYNMPKMTGLEALKKIRTMEKFRTIPVILLTGEEGELFDSIKQQVEALGGACLKKPFDFDKLYAQIDSMRLKQK